MKRKQSVRLAAALAALAVTATACGGSTSSTSTADSGDGGDGAATTVSAASCEAGQTDGDLAIYNWTEYIDPDLITDFEAEFGISVSQDFYDSNEAMQPIIAAGGSGFDFIVPSDYMVSILIEDESIQPINRDAIPNIDNLLPEFASDLPFDPAAEFSVPYQWGTTGLGVDLSVTGEDVPQTWGLVFDPEIAAEYNLEGQFATLLNDPRETLGAALKFLGYSLNTTDPGELEEAATIIQEARDRITAYDSDQYDELLVTGDAAVTHGFSGNFIAQFDGADNPDQFTYFVPEEGGTRWVDNMAIPFDAPHPCSAHTFINYLLDAERGAQLTNWNFYASPNEAAGDFIDQEVLDDPIVYPTDTSNLEFISDTGDFEINFSDAFITAKG